MKLLAKERLFKKIVLCDWKHDLKVICQFDGNQWMQNFFQGSLNSDCICQGGVQHIFLTLLLHQI